MKKNNPLFGYSPAILILLLAACSTNQPMAYDPNHSEAYNIAHNEGITLGRIDDIHDVPYEKLEEAAKNTGPDHTGTALGLASAAGDFSGLSTPPPGFSGAMSGAFFLLGVLLNTQAPNPALSPDYIVYMPESKAENAEQAGLLMKKMFEKAVKDVYREAGYSLTEHIEKFKPTFAAEETYRVIEVGNNECSDAALRDFVKREGWNTRVTFRCTLNIFVGKPLRIVPPQWVKEKHIYYFGMAEEDAGRIGFSLGVSSKKHGDSYDATALSIADNIYKQISHRLPSWVYTYLPPTAKRKYPVILNQDKVLYFIQPDPHKTGAKKYADQAKYSHFAKQ